MTDTGLGRRSAALGPTRGGCRCQTAVVGESRRCARLVSRSGAPGPARAKKDRPGVGWRALDLDGRHSAVLYSVGCLYAILGRGDEALRCLKKVVRSGWRKEWIR